jgi:hypothetical protein
VLTSALRRASQSGCVACELKVQFSQCDLIAKKDATRGVRCFEELNTTAAAKGFWPHRGKDGGDPIAGLLLAKNHSLYGTTSAGGTGSGVVFRIEL